MHVPNNILSPAARMSPTKRALLEMRLRGQVPVRTKTQAIPRRLEGAGAPLSFAQQRLWFLHQMAPESTVYSVPAALRLEGVLNLSTLEQAFSEIVRRHEVLRTTFAMVDGEPVQVISPPHRMTLPIVDLKALGKTEQEARVRRLIAEEARRSFDLDRGPLVRIRLLQLGEKEHLLLATLHHIVSDGWSIGVLSREMGELYEASCGKRSLQLPELPIQYADFAYWQRQYLQGETLEQQLAYWKEQLADLPVLDFPTDYPRGAVPTYQGASLPFVLSSDLTARLKAPRADLGVTLFTTLLAAFSVLLQRYTGQTDIVTGTVIANRNRPEIEGLIGFFVNALALRLDLGGNPTFRELLRRADEVVQGAYDHQDLPFDKLVQELKLPRDPTRNPLFQVSLALHNVPRRPLELQGLRITPLEVDAGTTQFDLTVHFREEGARLLGSVAYSTDLFAEATIEGLAAHFVRLLEGVAHEPDRRLSELPWLTESERRQVLTEWNATTAFYPKEKCLHELFEVQVEKAPYVAAAVCGAERLSYGDLNARANQLGHYLQARGIGPESLVGVCMERSVELIVAILGVLQAGGAYVPIDPNYPRERKAYLLTDSAARVVLTQARLIEGLPQGDTEFVCLDRDWETITESPASAPANGVTSGNLAYVIYTSGSMGRPKGVQISHRNAVHSTWARFDYYQEPVGCFLLLSSFAFDSSVAGIFWTLSQGGCLLLPEEGAQYDPEALVDLTEREKVTHLLCLPSLYQLILERGGGQLGSLQAVIVAGEACPPGLVGRHFSVLPGVPLFNEYGPTEGTVWSSVHRIRPEDARHGVPIGRPVGNVAIYLLAGFLNPVPAGVPGELYIGGEGVARGYLHRPEGAAERFIPNPFGELPGERLYRTGDLARHKSDGNIEYLGRIDHQVKIRGYRIELGEVEAALVQHPKVREAVVVVREDTQGDKRLVGYVVGEEPIPTGKELRAHLKGVLSEYIVPGAFVFLESLPLTPNGKVDRMALPAPDVSAQFVNQYVAPRSPTEETLAKIYAEVLRVERVGIHDNFFELGGHSILLMQLIFRVRATFKLTPSPRSLFEQPTVAGLAELMEKGELINPEGKTPTVDLNREAVLEPTIKPCSALVKPKHNPETVLLTGATGFLGAFLLHELLRQTPANVYCLVRAGSHAEARERLRRCLMRYEIWDPNLGDRILPVYGDLARPRLGLSADRFEMLAEQVDVIYHNGALVNFVRPYAPLKAVNVIEVLRLACTYKVKPVHYVSTLSVFGNEVPPSPHGFSEDDFPGPTADLGSGYAQSKWVAERMVRTAGARGLPVNNYRPATIGGHSQTGVWNTDDYLCRLIKGCIQIGTALEEDYIFDIVPVDYVSKAIIALSFQPELTGQAFHLHSPNPLRSSTLIDLCVSLGYPIERVPYAEWRKRVYSEAKKSSNYVLYPLLPMFEAGTAYGNDALRIPEHCYDSRKTVHALMRLGIRSIAANRTLFQLYFSFFSRNGFLEESPSASLRHT